MHVFDISVALGPSTPMWDDGPAPRLKTESHLAQGDHSTVTSVAMSSHSGTHTDAPAHFVAGAPEIDRIDPSTLVGPACVVEYTGEGHITAEHLEALGVGPGCERVLFKTANGDLWDRPGFQRDFVALAPSAAARLVELGVKLVAIDYLSIEAYETAEYPVHRMLLGAGIVVVEGVDLREVPAGEYLLVCAPLKLTGAEGAPTRAFLIEL